MSDVLDQSEVDALLATVDDTGGGGSEGSQTQVFTLDRRPLADDVEIRDYDFKRPERVSKDQMRALETLHESFSRNFGAALSGFLRTIMEVKVANIEQMTFSEFTHSLPNPTCFNLISCDPLDGSVCLEISPLIIYPVIDRLLGENEGQLSATVRDVETVSGTIASNHDEIDQIIKNLATATQQIAEITEKMNGAVGEIEVAAGAYGALAEDARGLVIEARPALEQLSNSSVPEVDRLLRDTRRMISSVDRLVVELERNPTEFLLGDEPAEYGN